MLHFCQQTLDEAVLYSKIREDAGGDYCIDSEILSEIGKELLAVELGDVCFPETPFEVFRVGRNDADKLWREWRELTSDKHSALRDRFVKNSRMELDKLKETFSKVQGDKFIGPLLSLCTSQLGERRPVPGCWTNKEGLEFIHYISVDTAEDIKILQNAIVKPLDRVRAAASKANEIADSMFREIAESSSLSLLKTQRDIIALATLSSPPSAFFEKFNRVDIDRERRTITGPVWKTLKAQPELCADFRLSAEELAAKLGWPAIPAAIKESWSDTFLRCFDEWQATPESREDGVLIARLVRMGTDEVVLRRYGEVLPVYRDAEALHERSLLALLPQLDRLSPAQSKWLVYHAYRTRCIEYTSNGSPKFADRGDADKAMRVGQFRDPAFLPAELTDGVLAALLDLLGEADCVSRANDAADSPRMLAALRLARAAHESPRHRAQIVAGFSRALRTVAGRDVRAASCEDFMSRVDVSGLIDLVCDMQARDGKREVAGLPMTRL